MMNSMGMWGGLGMLLWGLIGLPILVLAVLAIIWLPRDLGRRHREPSPEPGPTPRDILRRRYAAGEISEEEYRQRTSALADPASR